MQKRHVVLQKNRNRLLFLLFNYIILFFFGYIYDFLKNTCLFLNKRNARSALALTEIIYYNRANKGGKQMKTSTITAEFAAAPAQVWAIVTDQQNTGWRSDLDRVEVISDTEFIEYAKGGFATHFRITVVEPEKAYAFFMENQNFTGQWRGTFSETSQGGTQIVFTEQLKMKNPVIGLAAHLFMNLKKIQRRYVLDLQAALGR